MRYFQGLINLFYLGLVLKLCMHLHVQCDQLFIVMAENFPFYISQLIVLKAGLLYNLVLTKSMEWCLDHVVAFCGGE